MRNKLLFTAALFCVEMTPFGRIFTPAYAEDTVVSDKIGDETVDFVVAPSLPNQEIVNTGTKVYRIQGNGTNQTFSGSVRGNTDNTASLAKAGGIDVNSGNTVNTSKQGNANNLTMNGQNVYNGYTFVRGNGSLTLTGNGDRIGGIISGGETEVGLAANDSATMTVDKNGILLLRGQTDSNGKALPAYGQLVVGNGDRNYGAPDPADINRLGVYGWNYLNIKNGGQVGAQTLVVGNYTGGRGEVSVIGPGNGLTVGVGGMTIGNQGKGALLVKEGGKAVVGGDISLGSQPDGEGSIRVADANSSLTVKNGQTIVGDQGQGGIGVSNGGSFVTNGNLILGAQKKGIGDVEVDGSGSSVAVNADQHGTVQTIVGDQGPGPGENPSFYSSSLDVQNGGAFTSNGNLVIGNQAGGAGAVTVAGNNASITLNKSGDNTGNVTVGNAGNGSLTVGNQGSLTTNGNVIIGSQAGSIGNVVVGNEQNEGSDVQAKLNLTGSGSTGNLVVGQQGTGHLSVRKGGEVTAYGVSVGGQDTDGHLASNSSVSVGSYEDGSEPEDRHSYPGGRLNIGQGGLTVGTGTGSTPLYSAGVMNGGVINNAGTVNIKSDGQLKVGGIDSSVHTIGAGTLIAGDTSSGAGITSDATQVDKTNPTANGGVVMYGNGVIQNRQGSDLHVNSNVYMADGTPSDDDAIRHGTFNTNQQNTYLTGKVTGTGGLEATGGGTLYVANHDNSYQGETVVSGKDTTLAVASGYGEASDSNNSSSSGITVEDGARLTGNTTDNGAAAATTVEGGGTVESNWNQSSGTLNIGAAGHQGTALTMNGSAGNQSVLSVGASSTPASSGSYITLNNVKGYSRGGDTIDTTGRSLTGSYRQLNSGLIHVNGDAQLNSATINVVKDDSQRIYNGDGYRILTATGTVSANHDNALTGNLPNMLFLSPYLVFENQAVDVIYSRSETSFSSVATNRNERETGHALDGLSDNSAIVHVMTGINSPGEARHALTNLSGDIHASARTAMIQDSYLLEQAVLDRLADAGCDGDGTVSSHGRYDLYTRRKESQCYSDHAILWGQAYGSLGHNGGGGNAGLLHHQTAGFVMGVDTPIDDRWRLGGMIAYGHSMFNTNGASNSSGNSNNISLGSYAGSHWGRFNLRLGAFYTWNLMNTRRHVQVADFGGRQTSHYRSGTARAFTELSYKFNFGKLQFEPFLEGSYVNQYAGRFRERGVAALYGQSKDRSVGFTTFGFRLARSFQIGDVWLRAHAMAAYRRAYGSLGSSRTERFMAGGNDMNVNGVLLSRDAAVAKAGLAAKVSQHVDLDLSYIGQYGGHSMDSGATGSVNVAF